MPMYAKDYFEELKLQYPIAEFLNDKDISIMSRNGTLNKGTLLEDIWVGLEVKYVEILNEKNIEHNGNYGIACDFAAEPYFNKVTEGVKYKYVLMVYFYVIYPEFSKKGFYYRGQGKYYGADGKIEDIQMPKKSEQPLLIMAHELNGLVSKFLMDGIQV